MACAIKNIEPAFPVLKEVALSETSSVNYSRQSRSTVSEYSFGSSKLSFRHAGLNLLECLPEESICPDTRSLLSHPVYLVDVSRLHDSRRNTHNTSISGGIRISTPSIRISRPSNGLMGTDGIETETASFASEAFGARRSADIDHPHNCHPCRFHCFSLDLACEKGDDCGFCHLQHTSQRLTKKLKSIEKRNRKKGVINYV